jgi:hypothetical protein
MDACEGLATGKRMIDRIVTYVDPITTAIIVFIVVYLVFGFFRSGRT